MPYTFDSMHGPGVSGASAGSVSRDIPIQEVSSVPVVDNAKKMAVNNLTAAKEFDEIRGSDSSLFGELIRDALGSYTSSASQNMQEYIDAMKEINAENSALSQSFAREQMEYQKRSDANAMAWSANEAQKNRDYQERLSNTAHQREVKDLLAAGLNPILSANAGAYTGSGATGQGFSSQGAQGSVDTSVSGVMAGLVNGLMNSASNAASAKLYTDAQKYSTDMQYAMAKLNAETALRTNMNTNSANKAITAMNNDAAIKSANIHSGATLGAAGISAGATQYMADQSAAAAMFGAQKAYDSAENVANINKETQESVAHIRNESSPYGLVAEVAQYLLNGANGADLNPKDWKGKTDAISGATPSYKDYHGKTETQSIVDWLDKKTGYGSGIFK